MSNFTRWRSGRIAADFSRLCSYNLFVEMITRKRAYAEQETRSAKLPPVLAAGAGVFAGKENGDGNPTA